MRQYKEHFINNEELKNLREFLEIEKKVINNIQHAKEKLKEAKQQWW